MKRAIRAELRKLRYQRSNYGIVAAACALSAVGTISMIATTQMPARQMLLNLTDHAGMHVVMASAAGGYMFALVIGIVMATTEFRHSTAVATYLAEPNRRTVMFAKMLMAAGMGFVVQLCSTVAGMIAGNLYVARYAHYALGLDEYGRILAGSLLSGVVLAVVGVAVGMLIRSQMIAVVASILWLQLVEGLLIVFADWLGKWSMRGAITSVLDVAIKTPEVSLSSNDMFGPWQSVLILLAYGALFATAATMTTMRRDVD